MPSQVVRVCQNVPNEDLDDEGDDGDKIIEGSDEVHHEQYMITCQVVIPPASSVLCQELANPPFLTFLKRACKPSLPCPLSFALLPREDPRLHITLCLKAAHW